MLSRTTPHPISAEERILRAHWEWSRRYGMLWVIGTSIIFAGIFAMLEIVGAGERVQVPSLTASCNNDC